MIFSVHGKPFGRLSAGKKVRCCESIWLWEIQREKGGRAFRLPLEGRLDGPAGHSNSWQTLTTNCPSHPRSSYQRKNKSVQRVGGWSGYAARHYFILVWLKWREPGGVSGKEQGFREQDSYMEEKLCWGSFCKLAVSWRTPNQTFHSLGKPEKQPEGREKNQTRRSRRI